MPRGPQYSDEQLLDEICRLAEKTGREPPKKRDMVEYGEYAPRTLQLRFGSWNEAVREAGFQPREIPVEFQERPSTCPLCEDVDSGLDFHHWRYGENEKGCYLCRECHDYIHRGDATVREPGWLPAAISNLVERHVENHDDPTVSAIIERYSLPSVDDLVERELQGTADE